MLAHITAMRTALAATGWATHFVSVPDVPTFPYLLLWTSPGSPGAEVPLCGTNRDLEALVGVTAVAATPNGVLTVQAAARAILCPDGSPEPLTVAGRAAWLQLFDSQTVQVDRDVTIPTANRQPPFAVDLYRLTSTPA